MKHIVFWEIDPERFDKVIEKVGKVNAEREKFPDKFPEILFQPHMLNGEPKGFTIVDAKNAEQMANIMVRMIPEMKVKYVPLIEAQKLIEVHQRFRTK